MNHQRIGYIYIYILTYVHAQLAIATDTFRLNQFERVTRARANAVSRRNVEML